MDESIMNTIIEKIMENLEISKERAIELVEITQEEIDIYIKVCQPVDRSEIQKIIMENLEIGAEYTDSFIHPIVKL